MLDRTSFPTISQASAEISAGRLTSVALVEHCLDRIETYDKSLHSFTIVTKDRALREAKAADAEIQNGKRRGPLQGIPFGLKDIYDVAGLPTTANSRLLLDNLAENNSAVMAKLADAGAILIGKTHTHEFATGGPSFDLPWPPARNPWNTDYFTGGSSSGSAAAITAGLVPFAMGSDTAGSIRGPAGYCGITGFKPTYDIVSRRGVIPLSYSLDHCGPMAQTVQDCAMVMDAIAERKGAATNNTTPFTAQLTQGITGMRVGVVRHFFENDFEVEDEVIQAIDAGLEVLERLGAVLVPITLPPFQEWDACSRIIMYAEAFAIHERDLMTRPKDYAPITRARLFTGEVISASDYLQAKRWRRELCDRYRQAARDVEAVVTGNTLAPAQRIKDLTAPPYFTWRYKMAMSPFNLIGAPALSVRAGFSSGGLPLSLQIAGHPLDDSTVLRVGHAYEKATQWDQHRPILET